MRIVEGRPPNFEEIAAVFPMARGPGAIFTFGDAIYAPGGAHRVTPYLKAHEGVHYSRQTNELAKIEAWWRRYLVDEQFRLEEELPAHRAEFRTFCSLHRDPNQRIHFLYQIGERLSGKLYGELMTPAAARRAIADR